MPLSRNLATVIAVAAVALGALYLSRNEKKYPVIVDGTDVYLVVDIGSSSIRCTAFAVAKAPQAAESDHSTDDRCLSLVPGSVQRVATEPFDGGNADVASIVSGVNDVVDRCIVYLRKLGVRKIAKVGFSSFAMNLCGVDGDGRVVTPAYTYASVAPTDENGAIGISHYFSPEETRIHYCHTGTVLNHPAYASIHLHRYYANEKPRDVYRWTTFCSHIIGLWTGVGVACPVSYSEASWWGILNLKREVCSRCAESQIGWDQRAVARLHASFPINALPKLCDFDEFDGKVSGEYVAKWPELSCSNIYLGVGDGAAANIGSALMSSPKRCWPIDNDGSAPVGCITIGTSAAVRVVCVDDCPESLDFLSCRTCSGHGATCVSSRLEQSRSHTQSSSDNILTPLWKYRIDKDRILVGGALTDGGSLVQWFRECFGDEKLRTALQRFNNVVCERQNASTWVQAEATPFFSKGMNEIVIYFITFLLNKNFLINLVPVVLPFWSGERSTGWHVHASGVISGINRCTSSGDILHGIFEGIAVRLRRILIEMKRDQVIGGDVSEYTKKHGVINYGAVPIFATSGGALEGQCDAFCQLISDVCGYALAVNCKEEEVDSGDNLSSVWLWVQSLFNCDNRGRIEDTLTEETIEATSLGIGVLMIEERGSCIRRKISLTSNSKATSSVGVRLKKFYPRVHMHTLYQDREKSFLDLYDSSLNT